MLRLQAALREKEDLLLVGAYQKGSDPAVDTALRLRDGMANFLRQRPDETSAIGTTRTSLANLMRAVPNAGAA
jgi:flagellar biosynthesis/type III secretory pathway ATPase